MTDVNIVLHKGPVMILLLSLCDTPIIQTLTYSKTVFHTSYNAPNGQNGILNRQLRVHRRMVFFNVRIILYTMYEYLHICYIYVYNIYVGI